MKQTCEVLGRSHDWRHWRKARTSDRRMRTCRNCGAKQYLDAELARAVGPPKRAWSWPNRIENPASLLAATNVGFQFVTIHVGRYKDRPRYAFMRDGEISPHDMLLQGAARGAHQHYFEHDRTLEDGTIVYKRRTQT